MYVGFLRVQAGRVDMALGESYTNNAHPDVECSGVGNCVEVSLCVCVCVYTRPGLSCALEKATLTHRALAHLCVCALRAVAPAHLDAA